MVADEFGSPLAFWYRLEFLDAHHAQVAGSVDDDDGLLPVAEQVLAEQLAERRAVVRPSNQGWHA